MPFYNWKCPACGGANSDEIDGVDGPFITAICEKCNKCFDHTQLNPEEVKEWDEAITAAQTQPEK
jgi:predicted nucleic acid-binding Zn ribbon protein